MSDDIIEGKDGRFYRLRSKEQPPSASPPDARTIPVAPEAPLAPPPKKHSEEWEGHVLRGHDKPRRIVGVRMRLREDE